MRHERRAFWLGLLLAWLLARSLRALVSTAFYESLATLRLNWTALWLLALLAPLLAILPWRRLLLAALAAGGIGSAALPLARFTGAYLPTSAVASGAGLLALALVARRPGAIPGALCGLALDAGLLLLGNSHDPTLALWAVPAALLATLLSLALALRAQDAPAPGGGALRGLGFGALLALELAFLASPFALARWAGVPAWAGAVASLGGLALGATRLHGGRLLWIAAALALVDLALVRSPVVLLSIALLQLALGSAGARLGPALSARAGAVAFALAFAPLTFVLLFFRSPLGASEWGLLVPLLAVAALGAATRAPRAEHSPSVAVATALAALMLLGALPAPLADAPEGDELVVVTWNVHQAFGNRGALDPEIYADVLRELDADIVLLQEADTARLSSGGIDLVRYLADDLGMRAAYGSGGPAILSRLPFEDEPMREAEWMFEAAVNASGRTLWIESVHFGRSTQIREAQAREVVASAGAPRVVAGDLNLFGASGPLIHQTLTSRYQDAWIAAGHAPDDPAGHTFRLPNLRIRIDLVLVDGLEVVEADRVLTDATRAASDHLPVRAVVRLP